MFKSRKVDLITSSAILNALELRDGASQRLLRALRSQALRLDAVAYNAAVKGCDWRRAETLLRQMQQDLVAGRGQKIGNGKSVKFNLVLEMNQIHVSLLNSLHGFSHMFFWDWQVPWPATTPS